MHRVHLRAAAFAAAMSLPTASSQSAVQTAPANDSAAIVERARAAAGGEWGETVEFFCGDSGRANRADDPEIAPTRVFDNLYALGRTSTVVWALTTPAGILLIDAGYPDQLESVLLPQLRAAGLDPNDVRYVLARRTGTRTISAARRTFSNAARGSRLSAADWDLIENQRPRHRPVRRAPSGRLASAAPRRRRSGRRADLVRRLEITPVLIPGHTPGALGFVFRVEDGGRSAYRGAIRRLDPARRAGFPTTACANTCNRSSASANVTSRLGVDVEIQNHPLYDGFATKLERLRDAPRRRGASVRRRAGRVSTLS